jgi:hypothetical protein
VRCISIASKTTLVWKVCEVLREGWRYAELETKVVIVRSKFGPLLSYSDQFQISQIQSNYCRDIHTNTQSREESNS